MPARSSQSLEPHLGPRDVEPEDALEFTRSRDRHYARFAGLYDRAVKHLPVWRTWLQCTLVHLEGPRVLEVSFGTGWLLTRYAGRYASFGVDYNARLARIARDNLARAGLTAGLARANVEDLPFPDACFDSVLSTMAFSGYPRASQALGEMVRVLRPGGRLVVLDVGYPADGNRLGTWLARGWEWTGDRVRDFGALLRERGLPYRREEVGGFGSVQLYLTRC